MADPFAAHDPFAVADPFAFHGGGRRRQAAYPPLSEADTDTEIGGLTGMGLSGLGYVGSELDKLFGGRAIRAGVNAGVKALGGNGSLGDLRDVLSIIPGSDVAGLTNEQDTVRGEDILRNIGYDPSKGENFGWAEKNLVGPALEVGLDPTTYFGGIGALTRAGKASAKLGTLTKGLIPGVRAGERSLHPLVALAGKVTGNPLGAQNLAADVAQSSARLAGAAAGKLNVGVRKLPVVGGLAGAAIDVGAAGANQARLVGNSLFNTRKGPVPNAVIQGSYEGVKLPAKEALERDAIGRAFDLDQRREALYRAGAAPASVNRLLRQMAEGVMPKSIDLTMGPHIGEIESIAKDARQLGSVEPLAAQRSRGLPIAELDDPYVEHMLRRSVKSGVGRKSRERLLPTSSPSLIRRKEALRAHPGGTMGLEDYGIPEMASPARTLADKDVTKRILGDLLEPYGGLGPGGIPLAPETMRGEMKRAASLARFLKGAKPEQVLNAAGERMPFFNPDVIADAELGAARAAERTSSADALYDVAKVGHKLAVGDATDVSLTKAMSDAGLRGEQALSLTAKAVGLDPQAILAGATQVPNAMPDAEKVLTEALKGYSLRGPEARGATKLLNRWQVPEEWAPVLGGVDAFNKKFRDWTYSVWPASWGRNYGSAVAENAFEGTSPLSGSYRTSSAARAGEGIVSGIEGHAPLTPDAQRIALLREAAVNKVLGRPQGQVQATGLAAAPVGPTAIRESIPSMMKRFPKAPIETGKQVTGAIEEKVRLAQFLDLRRKGFTDIEAAKKVTATHFDYHDATDFENAVMKRLIPFYHFPSRNLPKQVGRAIQAPGKVSIPLRLSGNMRADQDQYVPEYLQSGLALPVGEEADGTQRYLSQLGLPMEEAFSRLKVGKSPTDTLARTLMSAAGMLGPIPKGIAEGVTGKQFYTGRDLADLHVGRVESLGGLVDDENARVLSQAVANSPGTRMLSTLNRLLDERKYTPTGLVGLGLGLTTGAKLTDVDVDKWRAIDARHNLEDLMRGTSGIRQSTDFYPTPQAKQEGTLSQEQEYWLRVYAGMKMRAREAAKEKRRVGVQVGGP